MANVLVRMAAGARRGQEALVNEDAIGINGWAIRCEALAVFPPWGTQDLEMSPTAQAPCVFVVADGVGGLVGSHEASLLVAEAASRPSLATANAFVDKGLNGIHRQLRAIQAEQPLFGKMGSTVVGVAVLASGHTVCFNVGDSRMYVTNAGSLVQASRDDLDSVPFVRQTRLGAWLGHWEQETVSPWIRRLEAVRERRVLLCSDGLFRGISEQVLQDVLCDFSLTPNAAVTRLFDSLGEPADDATAVVVEIQVSEEPPESGHPQAERDRKGRRGGLFGRR